MCSASLVGLGEMKLYMENAVEDVTDPVGAGRFGSVLFPSSVTIQTVRVNF